MQSKAWAFWATKQNRYWIAAILDFLLILIIIINGVTPAKRLLGPLVSPLQSLYLGNQIKITKEVFSFAPGLAQNKFDNIDFEGMNILAFYDVPITETGEIYDGRAYASFKSDESANLFQRAHQSGTKVVMTITGVDDDAILGVLSSKDSQQKLANQLIIEIKNAGIDGVNIDFEPQNPTDNFIDKYTKFVENFAGLIHSEIPGSLVAVSVPSEEFKNENFNDLSKLSTSTDRIFVIASNIALPETKDTNPTAPIFGYNSKDYFSDLAFIINSFLKQIPPQKLVFERAWYGNGDKYPLYIPNSKPVDEKEVESTTVNINQDTLERLLNDVPQKAKDAARKNIPIIVNALKDEGILDSNILAYALATVEHETDGTFAPIEEIGGRSNARRLGYEGGENYFGRGFIQLTHLRNYKIMGERIGMGDALAKNPDLASKPEVAAKILAAFFRDNNIANLASKGFFQAARAPINPDRNAYQVALLAYKYEDEF